MVLPGSAEADVRKTDRSPGEQRGEGRQRLQPGEYGRTLSVYVDVAQEAEGDESTDGCEGPAGAVNVGEDARGEALLGESGQGTRATVDAGDTDREDGDENDDVHEAVVADEAGVFGD